MYRYSICDPLNPKVMEMGDIPKEKIWDIFVNFPWEELYDKMEHADQSEIQYSPSLEIENIENRNSITISLASMENEIEFYISYKRPKKVSRLFGIIRYINMEYVSDKINQTKEDAIDAVKALLNDDLKTLEERWV